ncbi:hypothetical protein ABZ904_37335 [Streptomyces sp. NPDC046900]|uniref:hypothetical protein n=1 Tax=Streptomyces sp. NPDC046900 TaxID=3155473 RepID=UPI0033E9539E
MDALSSCPQAFGQTRLDELEDQLASSWRRCGPSATNSLSPNDVDAVADTQEQEDQVGLLEGGRSRFGRTYAGEPDRIAEELATDEAVNATDTVLFTVSNQLGVAWCVTQLTAVKAIMTEVDAMAPAA